MSNTHDGDTPFLCEMVCADCGCCCCNECYTCFVRNVKTKEEKYVCDSCVENLNSQVWLEG